MLNKSNGKSMSNPILVFVFFYTEEKKINWIYSILKVSCCNQFILATFKYIYILLKVAKINWLQPLTLKKLI